MAMVDVGTAAYRRAYSPSWLAWSEGRQPLGIRQMNQVYGTLESVVSGRVTAPQKSSWLLLL